jgi:hypothetical protein
MMYRSLPASYRTWVTIQEQANSEDFKALCVQLKSHYCGMVHRSGIPTVTALPAIPLLTSGYCPVPHDLKPYLVCNNDPGDKNPMLTKCAKNTCRDCLLTGHRAGAEQCQQFYIHCQLWGPWHEFQTVRRLAGAATRRQANAADGALPAGAETIDTQVTTLVELVSSFPKFSTFPALIKVPYTTPTALSVGVQLHFC